MVLCLPDDVLITILDCLQEPVSICRRLHTLWTGSFLQVVEGRTTTASVTSPRWAHVAIDRVVWQPPSGTVLTAVHLDVVSYLRKREGSCARHSGLISAGTSVASSDSWQEEICSGSHFARAPQCPKLPSVGCVLRLQCPHRVCVASSSMRSSVIFQMERLLCWAAASPISPSWRVRSYWFP